LQLLRTIESAIIAYFSNRLVAGTENDINNEVVYDEPSDYIPQFPTFPKPEDAKVYERVILRSRLAPRLQKDYKILVGSKNNNAVVVNACE
jgi:hypothetical protein